MNELFFEDLSSFELVGTCMAEAKTAAIFSNETETETEKETEAEGPARAPGNIKTSPYNGTC